MKRDESLPADAWKQLIEAWPGSVAELGALLGRSRQQLYKLANGKSSAGPEWEKLACRKLLTAARRKPEKWNPLREWSATWLRDPS